MNYHKITQFDTANGTGIRVVLWVSGCEHHCEGCHNQITWDKDSGQPFDSSSLASLLNMLKPQYVAGLTLSGGDPLAPYNLEKSTFIARKVKELLPDKNIWCYTGYDWETIKDLEIMKYLDVVVDGEFEIDKRDVGLPYCGSTNQRLIDVKKTVSDGELVIYKIE